MKEIINLHIGQAGIQIGNTCWELYCLEHGIQPDGSKSTDTDSLKEENGHGLNTIFTETNSGKYVPRAVYIDSEPTVVDEVRSGLYQKLFHPDLLVSGKQDCANNFAKGKYTVGKKLADNVLEKIRKLTEGCDNFQGFFISHSAGGGTGSGMACYLSERLLVDYGRTKPKVNFTVYPSPKTSTSVVEPYNSVLTTRGLLEDSDITVILDNEAIYDICKNKLEVDYPGYINFNRLIAQTLTSLNAPMRFGGEINSDVKQIVSNLVVYPRIHFMLSSYAPMIPVDKSFHSQPSIQDITREVFDAEYILAKFNPKYGKYIASCLLYRGDVVPKDVSTSINAIKTKRDIRFADYVPTGLKVGITSRPPTFLPGGDLAKVMRAVSMVASTTAIAEVFSRFDHKFDLMYAKRAYVHWYVAEGMEEGEIAEARENCAALEKDYEEIGIETIYDNDDNDDDDSSEYD